MKQKIRTFFKKNINNSSNSKRKQRFNHGRWNSEEHACFVESLKVHGKNFERIAEEITTRSLTQIRSHAQKHFAKQKKENQKKKALQKRKKDKVRCEVSAESSTRTAKTKPGSILKIVSLLIFLLQTIA